MAAVPRPAHNLAVLGAVLREYRREKGYTQEQLSFRCKLTTALISDTENGKRNLSFKSIERMLLALDVSWEDFGSAVTRTARRHRP